MRDPLERYFVYILLCSDKSYYVGITNDVSKRFAEHGEGIDPSCYTYRRRPLTLVFQQGFREVADALAWEKQIKGWSRKKKDALLRGDFDLIKNLSTCRNESHHEISMRRKYYQCVMLSPSTGLRINSVEAC